MCVAVPGKVLEIKGNTAKINVMNNITEADIRLVSVKPGDYVLLHAGCVIEVMKKDAAEELIELFEELEQ